MPDVFVINFVEFDWLHQLLPSCALWTTVHNCVIGWGGGL